MRTVEELEVFLNNAMLDTARNRIVDTGEAWSLMRENGDLRPDAPQIRNAIETDLLEYGFAIFDAALYLRRIDKSHYLLPQSFKTVGLVFESIVRNGSPEDPNRGFNRLIGAAAYSIGGYAATAFALFQSVEPENENLNPAELCLTYLILRNLDAMIDVSQTWLLDTLNQDGERLAQSLIGDEDEREEAFSRIIISSICKALSNYEFALRTGEVKYFDAALSLLSHGLNLANETAYPTLWWIIRITTDLIDDLWEHSLHKIIPSKPDQGMGLRLREDNKRLLFIISLFSRSVSQIELWPSQIDAAKRASNLEDDLIVALPTSAGKTRIAELACLMALIAGQRVLIVTPLRALSAQTERSFRETFSPLGMDVSSLYGKSGASAGDADVLRTGNIVVATPEKLDFALRSDPDIINDVGLIVLDEGHLIGPSEREIRYEILVQRLLKRKDANTRRVVCLSAILPSGEPLNDMTNWIRSDEEGEPIRSDWRPTRQRFGTLEWQGKYSRLNYDLNNDGPYISRFMEAKEPIGRDTISYPRETKDLTIMTAWEFAQAGKRVLVFITQANWVNGFGSVATKLVNKGYLNNLLDNPDEIKTALSVGEEWLGVDHPAVKCLKVGVAVHHGKLPSPFLREIERLLSSGVIKVTVASPTLAQGLNLNAAVLLVPYITRSGEVIKGEEFANVAGRAGRAFVDTEGLILNIIMDKHRHRKSQWSNLVNSAKARNLQSGLLVVIDQIIKLFVQRDLPYTQDTYEYLANARDPWLNAPDDQDGETIESLVIKLDAIVFGLVEALDSNAEDLPTLLDEALQGSLWARAISRREEGQRDQHMMILRARSQLIWKLTTPEQRKGHFAMGVGLESGMTIDNLADDLAERLDSADQAALSGDIVLLHNQIVNIARSMLEIKPFASDDGLELPENWEAVLFKWLQGEPMGQIGSDYNNLVEDVFVYRLVWALETIRTRRQASGWKPVKGMISGAAAACLDTGLPKYQMSLLVRSGLLSRQAALQAIHTTNPVFMDMVDLREWLKSENINELSKQAEWPTAESADLWRRYRNEMLQGLDQHWTVKQDGYTFSEDTNLNLIKETHGRLIKNKETGKYDVVTIEFGKIATMPDAFNPPDQEVNYITFQPNSRDFSITRIGPSSFWF